MEIWSEHSEMSAIAKVEGCPLSGGSTVIIYTMCNIHDLNYEQELCLPCTCNSVSSTVRPIAHAHVGQASVIPETLPYV